MGRGDVVFDDRLVRARAALAAGRPVHVVGTWGSGRTHLLRQLVARPVRGVACAGADDAHLLTGAAADAVADTIASGVPVVVTSARRSRLGPVVRRSLADRLAVVIELGPLDAAATAAFVAMRPPATTVPVVATQLARVSGGVLAVLTAMLDDGLEPGPHLTSCVDGLLDVLRAAERDVVTTLMVTGSLPVDLADAAFPARPMESVQALGVVVERTNGDGTEVALGADVVVTAADLWITPRRRRRILRRIVDGLAPDDVSRLSLHQRVRAARWAMMAGGDLELVRQGVRRAAVIGDIDTAVELGRHVVARDPDDTVTTDILVMALEADGDHVAAAELVTATSSGSASSLVRQATNVYLGTQDESTARDLADRSSAGADQTSEAAANLAWLHLFTGDVHEVGTTVASVLREPAASPQARLWACVVGAVAEVVAGGGDGALELLGLAERILSGPGVALTPYSAFQVEWTRAVALVRLGRGHEVDDVVTAGIAATSDRRLHAAWHGIAGLAARERGQFGQALEEFDRIGEMISGDPYGLGTWAASERDVCLAMLGATEPAAVAGSGIGFSESLIARNHAWRAAAAGDDRGAADWAAQAARLARDRGQATHEALALVDLARFGRPTAALAAAGEISRVDNPMVRTSGRVVAAIGRRDPQPLVASATACAGVGWRVVQAELLVLARAAHVRDATPTAAACIELAVPPRSWPTPILGRTDVASFVTEREREVGVLAMAGRSSDDIAGHLGIARRTVDNLLGRLYAKCGVGGRSELGAAVRAIAAVG